jgi:hypothetical protein
LLGLPFDPDNPKLLALQTNAALMTISQQIRIDERVIQQLPERSMSAVEAAAARYEQQLDRHRKAQAEESAARAARLAAQCQPKPA